MSNVQSIPTGKLPRTDTSLQLFRSFANGTLHSDPTQLFAQLQGYTPPDGWAAAYAAWGETDPTSGNPTRMCFMLIANLLPVPLVQHDGDPYFDSGTQSAGPTERMIPAAADDEIQYGLYAFANDPAGFVYPTGGVLLMNRHGTTLPYGLALGWRVSAGLFFSTVKYACAVSLHDVGTLEAWYKKYVDNSEAHKSSDTSDGVKVTSAVFETKTSGYTFMTVMVEAA